MSQPPWPPAAWPPAGHSFGPPAPPPRGGPSGRQVAWIVGGVFAGVALLVLIGLAAFGFGRSAGSDLAVAMPTMAAAPTSPPVDPSGLGDDPGLDTYAQRCHDGEMDACDDLAVLSDLMTDYEQYGMTCGGRVKATDVWACTDLG